MTVDAFNAILARRLKLTETVLGTKARDYATAADRLHNFKASAAVTRETPAQVCVGFFVKHLTSVLDMVGAQANGVHVPPELIDEKLGDALNYLILLEAILLEKPQS
jgi:hypothetical protein